MSSVVGHWTKWTKWTNPRANFPYLSNINGYFGQLCFCHNCHCHCHCLVCFIDIFLAGPFAKLLNLGNPETLFCQFKTVGVLRIEVFVILGSWFNRAGSYLFPWLNPSVFKYLESKHIKGPTGHTASYSVCSIQIFWQFWKCFKIFIAESWLNRAGSYLILLSNVFRIS